MPLVAGRGVICNEMGVHVFIFCTEYILCLNLFEVCVYDNHYGSGKTIGSLIKNVLEKGVLFEGAKQQ